MSGDEEYRIVPSEEEIRNESIQKMVQISMIKDRLHEFECDIENLQYLIHLLDTLAYDRDADGKADIRPIYREIRARISEISCNQMRLEQEKENLINCVRQLDPESKLKVIVKKL